MGLDIDAWYGVPWQQSELGAEKLIAESPSDFASEETLGTWLARSRALVTPPASKREGGALVLGRFNPPHLGHAFLLQSAEQAVKGPLLVFVVGHPQDRLSLLTRKLLVQQMVYHPRNRVRTTSELPVTGSPHQPEFWKAWADWLRRQDLSPEIRTLVASDPQARALADELKMDFVLVDPERRNVPISATMIRKAPWEHWSFIHPGARGCFAGSVVLMGPEGAGKTTLSQALARHYGTSRAAEFIAYWASKNPGKTPALDDFSLLLREELEILRAARSSARRFFVADTDMLSLLLWKQRLHGGEDLSRALPWDMGDLYFVLDDAPWLGPASRNEPAARAAFVRASMEAVRAHGRTPVLLTGPRESRAAAAIAAIDSWIRTNPSAWEK